MLTSGSLELYLVGGLGLWIENIDASFAGMLLGGLILMLDLFKALCIFLNVGFINMLWVAADFPGSLELMLLDFLLLLLLWSAGSMLLMLN